MASITIRNIDDQVKTRLRAQAADHGRSMAAEARVILQSGLTPAPKPSHDLAASIRAKFADLGGIDLPPAIRGPLRPEPSFND